MKNILVTTDLSEESFFAFDHALKLAQSFGATIHVLSVIEDPTQAAFSYALEFPVYPDPNVHEQIKQKVAKDLSNLCEKYFSGIPYDFAVEEATGPVHSTILEYARKKNAEVVVLATHGRTGLSRILIGSVAERIIREADRPVLVVPSK